MPLYSFHCEFCDKDFDTFCPHTELDKTRCPKGHSKIVRIFTPWAIRSEDALPVFEQVAQTNPDGTTTVYPAAKRLRKTHTRVLPKVSETRSGMMQANREYKSKNKK